MKKFRADNLVAVISLSLVLMFFNQTFLLNIDRSRSTFVLSWVDKGYVHVDSTNQIVIEGADSLENSNPIASAQRVEENVQRGLIAFSNNKFYLTLAGEMVLKVCEISAIFFDLKGWKANSS